MSQLWVELLPWETLAHTMEPAGSANFPVVAVEASDIFRQAEVETVETYENKLKYYKNKNYTFIPLPDSGQYYNTETNSLEGINERQYVSQAITYRSVFEILSEEPFLLADAYSSFILYVVNEEEYYTLPDEAPAHADALGFDELKTEYPSIADYYLKESHRYYFADLADLNRREVREIIYPVIAELEIELARAIKNDVDDPKDLYHNAPESVVGRREKDILNDVELHTAEYLGLGDMIGLLKGRSHLWKSFGFESANQVDDRLRSIQDLRNRVMHSNRTLVQNQQDVQKMLERINDAQRIIVEAKDLPENYISDTG